ncbi:MAG TPA: hypothetical protein ENJ69_05275 [Bacteroidetes bacterium]|nr:hypothetical protein [Bacteroidota bacterium]
MPFTGAHKEKEIDGILCRLVEENIPRGRMEFLKKLLEHNGYEVKVEKNQPAGSEEDSSAAETYNLWVTDVLFNPVVYVYELRLKTPDNKVVTPAYWMQLATEGIEKGEPDYYWELTKKA